MTSAPDVVLIFMDDMTHWSLRRDDVRTPNLDRLRTRGTTLTHAFNQGSTEPAVCVPARRMLLSGLTLFESESRFLTVTRLARALGDAGYDTFFTGKWHNQLEALEDDYDRVGPWAGGMFGSVDGESEAYRRPRPDDRWDPADRSRGGHWLRSADGSVQHSSERWTDAALEFLSTRRSDAPYFLHLAYHAPHDPKQAPQEYLDLYPISEVVVPPNALPVHPFDNDALDIRDELLAPHPRTDDAVRMHRREYFAMITHADAQIGRLLDAVERFERESERETIIVFSGDHGLALGEHGLMGKQSLYDHSTRVPLVIAGPGVPRSAVRDQCVYAGGIYATICDLAGIPIPDHVQFASLRPVIVDDDPGEAEIFTAYGTAQRSIRRGRWKLIAYGDPAHDQLFDVREDPWETADLIHDPDAADLVDELRIALARHRRQRLDPAAPR
ncbi:sulfatase-like hydrolase/transferase [Microbacterium awajiense]|uniref:Sulfatase-like hydrolase/transferase n=1 Tax=Microbacterium awajiense TaxID=415214 RepID=A0ABP7AKS1_9MICO